MNDDEDDYFDEQDKRNMVNIEDPFHLPITYLPSAKPVADNLVNDLELTETVDPSGVSVYSHVFKPDGPEAKKQCDKWAGAYTDDIDFLKDSRKLYKKYKPAKEVAFDSEFVKNWNLFNKKDAEDFIIKYHYVEQKVAEVANRLPMVLLFLSLYSMMSPVMFLLSPIFMLVAPFFIMKMKGQDVTWDQYKVIMVQMLRNHAIGALFTGSKVKGRNLINSLVPAVIFVVQVYYNCKSCFKFYKNISKIHEHIDSARQFVSRSVNNMDSILACTNKLSSYAAFNKVLLENRSYVADLHSRLDRIKPLSYSLSEIKQIGHLRALFYELRLCEKNRRAIIYCIGVQHYATNIRRIQALVKTKKLGAVSFKPGAPAFKQAYHPLLMDENPVKNSYKINKNYMITGPNASGKTTFVKTAMINVIFTQQTGLGFYKKASFMPFQELQCYLNIPDTSGRDSLFQAEARRCKEIVEQIDLYPSRRTFCIFDELYSGTNPCEASASAYAFLKYLANKDNCVFLLTTHFIDVCTRLQTDSRIQNVHMHTTDGEPGLKYHYEMRRGISKVRGGLQVLRALGYPKAIVDMASTYTEPESV